MSHVEQFCRQALRAFEDLQQCRHNLTGCPFFDSPSFKPTCVPRGTILQVSSPVKEVQEHASPKNTGTGCASHSPSCLPCSTWNISLHPSDYLKLSPSQTTLLPRIRNNLTLKLAARCRRYPFQLTKKRTARGKTL